MGNWKGCTWILQCEQTVQLLLEAVMVADLCPLGGTSYPSVVKCSVCLFLFSDALLQAGRGFEHLHLKLRLLQSFSYKDVSKLEFWKPLFLQQRCIEQKRVESGIYIPHLLLSL